MTLRDTHALILAASCLYPFCQLMADENTEPPTPLSPPMVMSSPKPHQTDDKREFQGIPGIERTPKGRLWAVWYGAGKTEDHDNIIMLSTSTDDGKTWSDIKTVVDVDGPVRCFDSVLWMDPDNRLWLFWAQAVSPDVNAHTWAMVMENPEEETPVWQTPVLVGPGVMMNKPTVLEQGEWLLPISDWEGRRLRSPEKATSGVTVSPDNGMTFQQLGATVIPPHVRSFDEQMVVEKKDGSLLMWIRTTYGIAKATSTDDGKSWSNISPTNLAHPSSRFFIRRLASGNLLLVKHWPLDKNLKARNHLMAFVSKDDGVTWEGGLLLDERDGVSYPDGVEGNDGVIRIIYDYSRLGAKEILMAAFTEEDVLAAKDVSGKVRLRGLVNKATGIPVAAGDLRSNSDGAPMAGGAPAAWKSETGTIAEFKEGAPIFSNRPYSVLSVPAELAGGSYLRSPIESTRATCTADGICYVITPSEGRNKDSLHAELLKQGFTKAALKEFLLFKIPQLTESNLMSTYQKSFKAGDELSLPKWGIVLIPKAE